MAPIEDFVVFRKSRCHSLVRNRDFVSFALACYVIYIHFHARFVYLMLDFLWTETPRSDIITLLLKTISSICSSDVH